MDWIYNGTRIDNLPEDVVGFVYCIYYDNGNKYVGKKIARSYRKKHYGKKKLAQMTDKRKKTYERIMTEHKWREYVGSSKDIPDDARIQSRVILHLCTSLTTLTWLEVKEMVSREVLTSDKYYNKNILGKFWDNCEDGLYKDKAINQPSLFEED